MNRRLKLGAAAFFLLLLLCGLLGCRSVRYVPVETVKTDSVRMVSAHVDTVRERDSTFVSVSRDTVRIERWRWRERVVERIDTFNRVRVDTISAVVEVEKPLGGWQKAKMEVGGIAMGAAALLALILAWRLLKR